MESEDQRIGGCDDQNRDESSPLLTRVELGRSCNEDDAKVAPPPATDVRNPAKCGWTADGGVAGGSVARNQWGSSLVDCLGRNDEFCSSDLEVCLLGSVAPCVLYGSNAERITSGPGTFASHCLPYSGMYVIGNSFFGNNCIAPWFSYPTRTAIRHKFNLEGTCESLHRSYGCCGSFVEDDKVREECELGCDFLTHVCCHVCALCQEGRELRRRVPHPGFKAQPILVMIPPREHSMCRGI